MQNSAYRSFSFFSYGYTYSSLIKKRPPRKRALPKEKFPVFILKSIHQTQAVRRSKMFNLRRFYKNGKTLKNFRISSLKTIKISKSEWRKFIKTRMFSYIMKHLLIPNIPCFITKAFQKQALQKP